DVPGRIDIAVGIDDVSPCCLHCLRKCSSWPGLSRPSTSCFDIERKKTWMPGTSPGMTAENGFKSAHAPYPAQSAVCAGHEPSRRRAEAGQAAALSAGPR